MTPNSNLIETHTSGKALPAEDSQNHFSEERYEEEMGVILEHAGANFMQVRLSHSRALGGDGSAVLVFSFILNLLRMKDRCEKDRKFLIENEMWFKCPAGRIQEELGMKEDRQRRAVRSLEEVGLIHTQHWQNNILWVKVDTEKLKEIDKVPARKRGNPETGKPRKRGNPETGKPRNWKRGNPGTRNGETPELLYREELSKNLPKNGELRRPPAGANGHVNGSGISAVPSVTPSRQDAEASTKLKEFLRRLHRKLSYPGTSAKWEDSFRLLRTSDGQQYQPVLDWYCSLTSDDIRRLGLPLTENGCEFRKRYNWVLDKYDKCHTAEREAIPISTAAEDMAGQLKEEFTNKTAIDSLPAHCQRAIDFFRQLRRDIDRLSKAAKAEQTLRQYADQLLDYGFITNHLAIDYLTHVARKKSGLERWSGRIDPPAYANKEFLLWFQKNYFDDRTDHFFNKFMALLKGQSQ